MLNQWVDCNVRHYNIIQLGEKGSEGKARQETTLPLSYTLDRPLEKNNISVQLKTSLQAFLTIHNNSRHNLKTYAADKIITFSIMKMSEQKKTEQLHVVFMHHTTEWYQFYD